jgi:enamine deaminase RidA (YjgF/YER057c/UK114 family)
MKFTFYCLLVTIALISAPFQKPGSSRQNQIDESKKGQTAPHGEPFRLFNPDTMAKPTAGYSQVAEINEGKIVYIAGQVALDRSGNLVGKEDFRAQSEQVFQNLKAAVEAAGGDLNSVIKLNYYCSASVDPSQFPILRQVRDKYINTANPPVSTLAVVTRLARPEWLIEVEAVAVVKK